MKPLSCIAAAGIAVSLLMGGGLASAMANETATSPPVQQSNIEPDMSMLTHEVKLIGNPELSDRPGPSTEPLGTTQDTFDARGDDWIMASEPLTGEGGEWRMLYLLKLNANYAGFYWIPESAVALSQPAGTAEASRKAAEAVTAAANKKHMSQFHGEGTVGNHGSWYASENTNQEPLAIAEGLGFRTAMSEPYEAAGQTWRKIDTQEATTGYVLASDVSDYKAHTPEPSEAPLIPADPEDHPANANNQAADASPEAGADKPGNIWAVVIGGGTVALLAGGGGYLFMQQRKRKGAAAVTEGVEEVSGE